MVLKTLFVALEGLLGREIQEHAAGFYVPGLGILTLLLLIFVAGILTRNIVGRKIVQMGDAIVHRVPIVSGVYGTFKRIVEAVSRPNQEKFNKVVLVEFPRKGLYSLGFVTSVSRGEVQAMIPEKVFNIFVPTTPNPTSGYLLMVPEKDMVPLSMSVEDGLKMVITGGLVTPPVKGEERNPGKSTESELESGVSTADRAVKENPS